MTTDPSSREEPRPDRDRSLTQRTVSGLFWAFSGKGAHLVLHLVVLVVLVRLLTPQEFGVVGAAMVIVRFSDLFWRLGVGAAVVQHPDLRDAHIRTGFALSLLLGALLAAILWAGAPWVSAFFRLDELTAIVRVSALALPITSVSLMARALLLRRLDFKRLTTVEVLSYGLGYGGVGITMAAAGFGPWALVGAHLGQISGQSIGLLMLQPHAFRPRFDLAAAKELLGFGTGLTLANVANHVASEGDNLVVGRWLGADALGLYGRAFGLIAVPAASLGRTVDLVLFPAMAQVQADRERLRRAYRRGIALVAVLATPTSLGLCLAAPEIVHVLMGPDWADVVVPFQVLAVALLFRTSYYLSYSLTKATGAIYRRAWRQGIFAVCTVAGAWVGSTWGLLGVAAGVGIAMIVNFLLMAQLSLVLTRMRWSEFWAVHLPGLALAALAGVSGAPVLMAARSYGFGPPLTLALFLVATGAAIGLGLWIRPAWYLGPDGDWMVQTGATAVRQRLLKRFRSASEPRLRPGSSG